MERVLLTGISSVGKSAVIVMLLSAPKEFILERLRSRINNNYGKHSEEATRVLALKDSVEPILRKIAADEINTGASIDHVLSEVLRIAASR